MLFQTERAKYHAFFLANPSLTHKILLPTHPNHQYHAISLSPPCFVSKIKSRGQILSKRLTAGLRTLAFKRFGLAKLMPLMPKNTALEGIVTFTRFPYISGARIRQKIKKMTSRSDLSSNRSKREIPNIFGCLVGGCPKMLCDFFGPGDFLNSGINLWIPLYIHSQRYSTNFCISWWNDWQVKQLTRRNPRSPAMVFSTAGTGASASFQTRHFSSILLIGKGSSPFTDLSRKLRRTNWQNHQSTIDTDKIIISFQIKFWTHPLKKNVLVERPLFTVLFLSLTHIGSISATFQRGNASLDVFNLPNKTWWSSIKKLLDKTPMSTSLSPYPLVN